MIFKTCQPRLPLRILVFPGASMSGWLSRNLVHGWDRIKNLDFYSLLALSTLKNVKCYPTMTTKLRQLPIWELRSWRNLPFKDWGSGSGTPNPEVYKGCRVK